MTQTSARRPGRPATGETPQRKVRMGPLWDSCAALAAKQGITMTEFVERALKREHQRVERILEQQRAEADRAARAATAPVTSELNDDQAEMMVKVRRGSVQRAPHGRLRFGPDGRPYDLTQGEDLMLDTLINAEMVEPVAQPAEYSIYPQYNLTDKGKVALIEWQQIQDQG